MADHLEQLKNTIPKLSNRLTAAVVAECAERVRGTWGAYQERCDELYDALDAIWHYAITDEIHPKMTEHYDFVTELLQSFND